MLYGSAKKYQPRPKRPAHNLTLDYNLIMPDLLIKNGLELNGSELGQMGESLSREFRVPLPGQKQLSDTTFFLLVDNGKILSMGGLLKTEPVVFDGETFNLVGFVNVIANVKGKGYGKRVMVGMKGYLVHHNITGIGFCKPENQEFYRKCGFQINTNSTQRFVYQNGDKRITNQDGQYIFYHDSSDNFMKKVLAKPDADVSIPSANLW